MTGTLTKAKNKHKFSIVSGIGVNRTLYLREAQSYWFPGRKEKKEEEVAEHLVHATFLN